MPSLIAVGVDGSAPGYHALNWAMNTAAARRVMVVVIIARPVAVAGSRESARSADRRHRQTDDQTVRIREGVDRVTRGSAVATEVLEGDPAEALLAIGNRAQLLVVGGHGTGGWRDVLNPSVTDQLATHTTVPLCVVRDPPDRTYGRIVVGHDGTGAAVRFAAAEAQARGSSLQVVSTWHYPRDTKATSAEAAGILEEGAAAAAAPHIDDARRNHPTVPIDSVVRLGHPAEELAALAATADMAVVGAQSRGGFATLLTGSVAVGVLHRVRRPVVVVPQ